MLARLCRAYADAWHADRYAAPAELDDPYFDPRAGVAGYRTADGRIHYIDVIRAHDPGHGPADDHHHNDDDISAAYHLGDVDRTGPHRHWVDDDPPGADNRKPFDHNPDHDPTGSHDHTGYDPIVFPYHHDHRGHWHVHDHDDPPGAV